MKLSPKTTNNRPFCGWFVLILICVCVQINGIAQSKRIDKIYKFKNQLTLSTDRSEREILYYSIALNYLAYDLDSCKKYVRLALDHIHLAPLETQGDIYLLKAYQLSLVPDDASESYAIRALGKFEKADAQRKMIDAIAWICKAEGAGEELQYYLNLLEKAKKISLKNDYKMALGYLLYVEALLQMRHYNYEAAEELFQHSLDVHIETKHSNPSALISEFGNLYYNTGKYAKALEIYKMALPYIRKSEDLYGYGYIYGNLAIACKMLGKTSMAKSNIDQSIKYRSRIKNNSALYYAYLEKGLIHIENNEYENAKNILVKLESIELDGQPYQELEAMLKASICMREGALDSAQLILDQSLGLIGDRGNYYQKRFYLNYLLMQLAQRRGEIGNWGHYFQSCLELSEKLQNQVLTAKVNLLAGQKEWDKGNFEAAYVYFSKSLGTFDYHQAPVVAVNMLGNAMLALQRLDKGKDALKIQDSLNELLKDEGAEAAHVELSNAVSYFNSAFLEYNVILLKTRNKRWLIGIISLLLALFLIALFLFSLNKKRKAEGLQYLETADKLNKEAEHHVKTNNVLQQSLIEAEVEKERLIQLTKDKEASLNKLSHQLSEMSSTLQDKERQLAQMLSMQLQKNELTQKVYDEIRQLKKQKNDWKDLSLDLKNILDSDTGWHRFRMHFDQVHPYFFESLLKYSPTMTSNEQRISALIKMGLKNKEIASILGVSVRAVDKSKERLKKKLEVEDLNSTIMSIT